MDTLFDEFKAGGATDDINLHLMDGLMHAGIVRRECARQWLEARDEILTDWSATATQLQDKFNCDCPSVWAPAVLLTETQEALRMRDVLIKNPKYQALADNVVQLSEVLSLLRKLNEGSEVLIQEALLDSLSAACDKGQDVIAYTYALFMLTQTIPKLSDVEKAEAATKLEAEMAKRNIQLDSAFLDSIKCLKVLVDA